MGIMRKDKVIGNVKVGSICKVNNKFIIILGISGNFVEYYRRDL